MRDPFGLAIRNEILSGALTLPVAALDALSEPHRSRCCTARTASLPRRIGGEADADAPCRQLDDDRAEARVDDAPTSG
jgi:hypothetical protein